MHLQQGQARGQNRTVTATRGKARGVGTPLSTPTFSADVHLLQRAMPSSAAGHVDKEFHTCFYERVSLPKSIWLYLLFFFLKKLWPSFISVYEIKKHSSKKWLVWEEKIPLEMRSEMRRSQPRAPTWNKAWSPRSPPQGGWDGCAKILRKGLRCKLHLGKLYPSANIRHTL